MTPTAMLSLPGTPDFRATAGRGRPVARRKRLYVQQGGTAVRGRISMTPRATATDGYFVSVLRRGR